jgi:flagellar hook-basal body complex protein FliE
MVSAVNPMASALQQMQAMAAEASGPSAASAADQVAGAGDFASYLKSSLDKVNASQQTAEGEAKAFELGASDVSLNDVMLDGQKANIEFQTAVQVRNKLVTAYNDIMQMTV